MVKHDQSDGTGRLPADTKENPMYRSLDDEYLNFVELGAATARSRSPTMPLPLVFEYGECEITMLAAFLTCHL